MTGTSNSGVQTVGVEKAGMDLLGAHLIYAKNIEGRFCHFSGFLNCRIRLAGNANFEGFASCGEPKHYFIADRSSSIRDCTPVFCRILGVSNGRISSRNL